MSFPDPTEEMIAKYPLPKPYVHFANLIAKWIDVTVPCLTTAKQSEAVTDQVISYLRSRGVSDMVISEALSNSVYRYPFTRGIATGGADRTA